MKYTLVAAVLFLSILMPRVAVAEEDLLFGPTDRCVINLTRWCIPDMDGQLTMTATATERVWHFVPRIFPEAAPLKISENWMCFRDTGQPLAKVFQGVESGISPETMRVSFSAGVSDCKIDITWETGDETIDFIYSREVARIFENQALQR